MRFMADWKRPASPLERKAGQRVLGHQCSLKSAPDPPLFLGVLRQSREQPVFSAGWPSEGSSVEQAGPGEGEEECWVLIFFTRSPDGSGWSCRCSLRKA